jgi:hypothetical protein
MKNEINKILLENKNGFENNLNFFCQEMALCEGNDNGSSFLALVEFVLQSEKWRKIFSNFNFDENNAKSNWAMVESAFEKAVPNGWVGLCAELEKEFSIYCMVKNFVL